MKYRPILMSTEMVKAIAGSRKTQTRRTRGLDVVNRSLDFANQPNSPDEYELIGIDGGVAYFARHAGQWEGVNIGVVYEAKFPYGQVGDRLWVKEHFYVQPDIYRPDKPSPIHYKADEDTGCLEDYVFKPSIFMPRWASRTTLEITRIRAERVQDLSIDDVYAEGIKDSGLGVVDLLLSYAVLWDSINAKRGYPWESNPWVWVIEFKIVEEETKW